MSSVVVRWIGVDGLLRVEGEDSLTEALESGWCWIDLTDPDERTLAVLAEPLTLHPLSIEDALHRQIRPKLDMFAEGSFITWLTPHLTDSGDIETEEVDCLLLDKVLLTTHTGPAAAIEDVARDAEALIRKGPEWVLHSILDRLVDSMLPVVDALGEGLESVEDRMLDTPARQDLDALYALRRQLLVVQRIVAPERDILLALARERDLVSEEAYRYFADVVDHLLRVGESIETYRDIGSAVMDIYLSVQSNRLNEIMKVLTVVTVMLGAVTAISGIYGMNLLAGMWPPVDARWSFWVVIGAMVIVAAVMSAVFRRKNWW